MSRGRPATLPGPGWQPPDRQPGDGSVVQFIPEDGSEPAEFSFAAWPVSPEMQQGLAAAFALVTAADGSQRSRQSAVSTYAALRRAAEFLGQTSNPPGRPQDLTPAHLTQLRLAKPYDYIRAKVVLRAVRDVTPAFAGALGAPNPRRHSQPLASYSKTEFSAVMAAARGQIRTARTRIRASRELLTRWRAGQIPEGTELWHRGSILDHVARTGDVPRTPDGRPARHRLGTVAEHVSALHLTAEEKIAAGVLLAGLTGHNLTGISDLTVSHHRADGDETSGTTRVAIVEIVKNRRGRRRRYMPVPLADTPDRAEADAAGSDDLSTPFGVFATICELTADSRAVAGTDRLLIGRCIQGGGGSGRHWSIGLNPKGDVREWAAAAGIYADKTGPGDTSPQPLALTWQRLRLTFVQMHQRGVAHTDGVLASQYLLRDRGNIDEYRKIVASVLAEQEQTARDLGVIRTLSDADLQLARQDPGAAAARLGMDAGTLRKLLAGQLDTALAGCTDDKHSPYTENGQPCRASFLLCLGCPNARATPAHLPVQALAHQKILALRPAAPPDRWARRFGLAEAQLRHLLGQYSAARVASALALATDADAAMIDRLLAGHLDAA